MWKNIVRPKCLIGYEISDEGEVRDIKTKIPHTQHIDGTGYPVVKESID
jgi:hypothetical protein